MYLELIVQLLLAPVSICFCCLFPADNYKNQELELEPYC